MVTILPNQKLLCLRGFVLVTIDIPMLQSIVTNQLPMLLYRGEPIANAEPILEDSFVVKRFLQNHYQQDASALELLLDAMAPWTDPADPRVQYRGRELARQKFFLVKAPADAPTDSPPSVLRKYGYPGFQYASMMEYRPIQAVPVVHELVELMQRDLTIDGNPVVINHVIGTRYRDASDNIGYHSDKLRDIAPNSYIISLSFGESREIHIGHADPADPKKTIFECTIVLEPGDLFVLGPRTNAAHRHAIVPVSEERILKRDPQAVIRPRISLVFRHIATQVTLAVVRNKIAKKKRAADGDVIVKKPRPVRRHKPE